jgi:two-component system, chemotaxis family, sensor kinase CheA
MDKFAQKYVEEATEILAKLESHILAVEDDIENIDIINEIFRLMHTLKGGGAMFGFNNVTDVTHELESIYDLVRNGNAIISKELLDASFNIIDYVKLIISESKELENINHKEKVDSLIQLKEKIKKAGTKKEEVVEKKKVEKKQTVKKQVKKTTPKKESVKKKQPVKKKEIVEKNEPVKKEKTKIVEEKKVNEEIEVNPNTINSYQMFFKPHIDTLKNGTDPLLLIREITELGLSRVFPVYDYVPDLLEITYDNTFLSWFIILVTDDRNAIDDIFIFVEDDAIIDIKVVAQGSVFENEKFVEEIDLFVEEEINKLKSKYAKDLYETNIFKSIDNDKKEVVEEKIETTEKKQVIVEEKDKVEEIKEEKVEDDEGFGFFGDEDDEEIEFEETQDEEIEKVVEQQTTTQIENQTENYEEEDTTDFTSQSLNNINPSEKGTTISSLRVSAEKVDTLMNLVSELITTQARLSVFVETQSNGELELITENLQKLSRQLRDNAFELSMIPLQSVVIRFQRLIRDLSSQLNKNIEFKTKGTSTELDKRIIENLIDPIMHLIRNCIDHGIETKEERQKSGKSETGTVFLNAYYSGTNVFLQVGDDGKGIDIERIQKKAIEKGFLSPKAKHKYEDIVNVIFEPGFSMTKQVSEVSGRGVGLDVVKRKVSELRGEIKTETKQGEGTTFTIKLPLTLSIIDGLLVQIGNEKYVVPMNIVNKIYEIQYSDLDNSHYNILELDNQQIPYYYLRNEFNETSEPLETVQVLVVVSDDKSIGIIVDRVIGENQAVLKPLGKMYKQLQIFSGATILGDGTVALVMDVLKIAEQLA